MGPWFHPRIVLIFLIALLAAPLRSQTLAPAVSGNPAPAPSEAPVAAKVQSRSLWDISTTLRASGGWRNNVAVSAFHPVDRGFWRGEAEVFALRPLGTDWQLISFFTGDVLRYFDPPVGVSGEQEIIAHLETRWQATTWLRAALKTDGFTQTTFIDPSQTEGSQLAPLRVRVRGVYATFAPRLSLPWHLVLEPSLQARRIIYRGYNGHYNELRPGVRAEWKHGERLTLSAGWYEHTRHYTELTQSRIGGRPEKGWLLSLRQREAELKATTRFEAAGTWTVSALGGRLQSRDRAYGFLDYDQERAQVEANWARGRWRITVNGDARHLEYTRQKIGSGPEELRPARISDAYELSGRVERDLFPGWSVFAEERWERNRSNAQDENGAFPFSYRTNTAVLGVQRTF